MGWCCIGARKKPPQKPDGFSRVKRIRLYSIDDIRSATNNFHPSNKIGRGGFGIVYKGTLRNGTVVAAKVLSADSRQGINEFLTEIDVISNIKHPNLVELLGCCVQEANRILVYEFAEKNSIDQALLGPRSRPADFNWEIRSKICLGTAKGLAYLHEEVVPHIVHRDIKASNILLDGTFVPKIGDFGLAKLFPDNVTHISTRVAGTSGYLAPEYAVQGQLTRKADVYSFGVLLLEIISAKNSSKGSDMDKCLLEWTWQLYEEEKLNEMIDPQLKDYQEDEVLRYIKVGLFCTQGMSTRRPTMTQVVEMLSKPMRLNENELTPPGLLQDLRLFNKKPDAKDSASSSSINTSTACTSANITLTEMVPR